jgi:hypothetical protein
LGGYSQKILLPRIEPHGLRSPVTTRDAALDPGWLRIGTDIVGGTTPPTFNTAFSLSGNEVPEPTTIGLVLIGLAIVVRKAVRHR